MKKMFKKIIFLLFTIFLLGCSTKNNIVNNNTENNASNNQDKDITIVFTNDIHCGVNDNIKISGLMSYYKSIDENKTYKALIDVGDFSQGGIEGSVSKGELMYTLMNELGYDFVVPGNHEFDYGIDRLLANSIELSGIMYCCNFMDLEKGESVFDPYKIMTFGNKKVAFIGACTPHTIKDTSLRFYQDESGKNIYGFCQEDNGEKLFQVIQESIDNAKNEGADYVILVAHMGETEILYPFNISNIIGHVEGLDAVIDGHTHHIYNEMMKDKNGRDIPVAQAGTKMQDFGVLNIKKDGDIQIVLYDKAPLKEDSEVQTIIDNTESSLKLLLDKILYKNSKVLFTIKDLDTGERAVRTKETNLADFVADSYRYVGKSDIAVINGGGVRDDIPEGDITYNEVLKVCPFSNMLCVAKIKGKDLLDYLEFGAKDYPEENGHFVHPSGFTYTIDATKKSNIVTGDDEVFVKVDGEYRVKDVLINGEPLDLEKEYTICGQDYVLIRLGGGTTMFKNIVVTEDNFISDIEALEEYLKVVDMDKYKNPKGDGRIKIIEN